jgi:hypothetical protein
MKKVYAVVGGFPYEGESADSLELFKSAQAADDYGLFLQIVEGYDYYLVEERQVR